MEKPIRDEARPFFTIDDITFEQILDDRFPKGRIGVALSLQKSRDGLGDGFRRRLGSAFANLPDLDRMAEVLRIERVALCRFT